ncbi:patatin-like protein [Streptomyces fildesensis]|uniref:Patatin-like protein n=1 Tax=Streptomyces fildesensis TaxID=375757 RepID=A0ABW8C4I7_9ACTN
MTDKKTVDAHTQEIRIATAMTGGVSLAIWMGGVARELNLLQQAAWLRHREPRPTAPPTTTTGPDAEVRDLYVRLLDLLDVTVSIDMLSGTSAGGINGALLGLARARSKDLGDLRDFWLKSGAFEGLLRDPKEKNPPSLMYGDEVLLKELQNVVADLKGSDAGYTRPTEAQLADTQTRLFITTTLLTGETSRFTDAYGTQVQDVDHRGLLEFNEKDLTGAGALDLVALAARCSASFPAAFEPAFVPFATEIPASEKKHVLRHPAMRRHANITRNHWVADGGLLANRPIKPLLQSIFDRPADRQIRRVLLYVVPSPGEMPDPRAAPPKEETKDAPWTLGEALVKDLGSVLSQSIGADLTTLQQHNDRVDSQRNTRLRMAEIGARTPGSEYLLLDEGPMPDGGPMLTDYRAREATWLVNPVISALMKALTTMAPEQMPESWRLALKPGGSAERDCRQAAAQAVSEQWHRPQWGVPGELAAFGRPAFDGARATVIGMLQAAYVAEETNVELWDELSTLSRTVHAEFVPESRPDADLLIEKMLGAMALAGGTEPSLKAFAAEAANEYATGLVFPPATLTDGWLALALVVATLKEICLSADAEAPAQQSPFLQRPSAEQRRLRAARELGVYLKYLAEEMPTDMPAGPAAYTTIMFRLFELHVATRSVLPVGVDVEQPVELIQMSADTRNTLAPKRFTAAKKLTGMQLNHFGAFYKSSWRANDWTWGRMDGAGWLVHLLLDPRRIETIAEAGPKGGRAAWFYRQLCATVLGGTDGEADGWSITIPGEDPVTIDAKAVQDELHYLDDPALPIPASLPLTSLWLARRWQEWIAAQELPTVAAEMLSTPATRYDHWAVDTLMKSGNPDMAVAAARTATVASRNSMGNRRLRRLIGPIVAVQPAAVVNLDAAQAIAGQLATCPVPDETLAKEVGEPLFTRTVTKALATTTACVTAVREPPLAVASFFISARTVTLAGYRAAAVTGGWPRRGAFFGGLLIVLGVVAISTLDFTVARLVGAGLVGAGLLLLSLAAWGWRRWVLPALGSVVVVAVVGALAFWLG